MVATNTPRASDSKTRACMRVQAQHTQRRRGPPAPAPGASTESKIAKLVELGFDRAKCAEALEASGGNEEYAASLLFSGF